MNENLNIEEGMIAYVRYRLEKAQETFQAALVLYDAAQWNYYKVATLIVLP